jgi:SAM-dependent methyltransferase
MAHPDWDDNYVSGNLPWDTGRADPGLIAFVRGQPVAPGRALEVGCGTGNDASWLAEQGFDVLGVDVAPHAIERARARGGRARFEVLDFLATTPGGPFDLVFDRGCFHTFDEADDRAKFAANVAAVLAPNGLWLSLLGSTEGPPRDLGPPRRSARDIVSAIEPFLAIVALIGAELSGPFGAVKSWQCVAGARSTPAQPSTRRS